MKKKIMIVDDNPDLTLIVKNELERLDTTYQVTSVNSGDACFSELKKGYEPDLILLDIMMPEMNGWDVLAKLRKEKEWEEIPVVFLTAKTDDTSIGLGTLTCQKYITKPFEIPELKIQIDQILRKTEGQ